MGLRAEKGRQLQGGVPCACSSLALGASRRRVILFPASFQSTAHRIGAGQAVVNGTGKPMASWEGMSVSDGGLYDNEPRLPSCRHRCPGSCAPADRPGHAKTGPVAGLAGRRASPGGLKGQPRALLVPSEVKAKGTKRRFRPTFPVFGAELIEPDSSRVPANSAKCCIARPRWRHYLCKVAGKESQPWPTRKWAWWFGTFGSWSLRRLPTS